MIARQSESPAVRGMQVEELETKLKTTYNWGYEKSRRDLLDLYAKAKRTQWNSDETLPWELSVDLEKQEYPEYLFPLFGSDIYRRLTDREKLNLNIELDSWLSSQFLHGEQGALLAASQLVTTVPDYEAKLYAGSQVMDEARHVEVYDRYLHEKIGFSYPVSPHLKSLLDLILKDERWDMKLLGMQIMVEGLALAAFGMIRDIVQEPLMKKLTTYVMQDEARHVAFGILALKNYYGDMKESERLEREDFLYEGAVLMRDRFLFEQVWEKAGLPVEECKKIAFESEGQRLFRQMLFTRIVPAVKRIGLLSPRQRERFEKLGILQFEACPDPSDGQADAAIVPYAHNAAAATK